MVVDLYFNHVRVTKLFMLPTPSCVLLWLRVGLPSHSFLMAGFGGFSLTFAGLILWYVCNLSFLRLLSK